MTIELNAADPSQVSSATTLQVQLGDPPRRMYISSGVAMPEFKTDGSSTVRESVRIRLGIPALGLEQSTVHVGLASVSNDESDFVFAVDGEYVALDEATQELVLMASLAVRGDDSALHRFSYQVIAITADLQSRIAGTLSWHKTVADPGGITQPMKIAIPSADKIVPGVGTALSQRIPMARGRLFLETLRLQNDRWTVDYEIVGLPINVPLQVGFELRELFPTVDLLVSRDRGLDTITVTKNQYVFTDQDYSVVRSSVK